MCVCVCGVFGVVCVAWCGGVCMCVCVVCVCARVWCVCVRVCGVFGVVCVWRGVVWWCVCMCVCVVFVCVCVCLWFEVLSMVEIYLVGF